SAKCFNKMHGDLNTAEEGHDRHCRLLRARRERPHSRPAEQHDEIAPAHRAILPVLPTGRIARPCCAAGFQFGSTATKRYFVPKTDLRAAAKAVAIRSLRQGLLLGLVPGIEGAAERFITES